jgi:hypothetical protein
VHGCRIDGFTGTVTTGAPIVVRLEQQLHLVAWVRWQAEGSIGIEFSRPLPPSMLQNIAVWQVRALEMPPRAFA